MVIQLKSPGEPRSAGFAASKNKWYFIGGGVAFVVLVIVVAFVMTYQSRKSSLRAEIAAIPVPQKDSIVIQEAERLGFSVPIPSPSQSLTSVQTWVDGSVAQELDAKYAAPVVNRMALDRNKAVRLAKVGDTVSLKKADGSYVSGEIKRIVSSNESLARVTVGDKAYRVKTELDRSEHYRFSPAILKMVQNKNKADVRREVIEQRQRELTRLSEERLNKKMHEEYYVSVPGAGWVPARVRVDELAATRYDEEFRMYEMEINDLLKSKPFMGHVFTLEDLNYNPLMMDQ